MGGAAEVSKEFVGIDVDRVHADFNPAVAALRNAQTMTVITAMTKSAERGGVEKVKAQLMRTVYLTPEDPRYQRTRDLYNAVKARGARPLGIIVYGEVYIDPNDLHAKNGVNYSWVMEHGTFSWYWWGRPATRAFEGRHFMWAAQLLIKAEFFGLGVKARNLMVRQMIGRAAGNPSAVFD